jgi:PAS domain S-box-containing protein
MMGRQRGRTLLGYAAGAVLLAAGYIAVYEVALTLVVDQAVVELGEWARVGGEELGEHLGSVIDDLRNLVNERARGSFDETSWVSHMDRFRNQRAPLVRAVLAVDSRGAITGASPRDWSNARPSATHSTIARALTQVGVAVSGPTSSGGGDRFVVVALAVPGDQGPRGEGEGGVAVIVDLGVVARRYVARLARRPGEAALLLAQDGQVLAAAAAPQSRTSSSSERSTTFFTEAAGLLAQRISVAGENEEIGAAGHTYMVGKVVPVNVAGTSWFLAGLRAKREVVGQTRSLLLLTGFLAIVAVAAGAASFAGVRALLKSREAVEREAALWRQAAEDARREERWQIIAEEAGEPIVFLSGLEVVAANQAAVESLAEGSRSSLLGVEFLRFVAPEDRAAIERRLVPGLDRLQGQETIRASLVTVTGDRRVAALAISAVAAESGGATRVSWQDLTSRERAEALLRVVSAMVPVTVLLLDGEGTLVWANEVFSEMTQYPVERFAGETLETIIEPRERRRARATFARALRGRAAEAVIQIRRQDGDLFNVALRASPVFVAGQLYRIVVVAFDAAAAPAFAGWNRLPDGLVLADLAVLLSHRLNNDLQALIGLLEKHDGESEAASPTGAAARRLVGSAIRQLQQFSVLTRSVPSSLQPLSLGSLLDSWREAVAAKVPSGVRLLVRREGADDLVHADAAQLTLLLDLALAAAVPGMEGGGTFEVSLGPAPYPGALRLSFFDTGGSTGSGRLSVGPGGMLAAPARTMVQAVARLVARRHQGSSGSKSGVGSGNRLWCDLVLRPAEESRVGAAGKVSVAGRVLLADDEELVRSGLAEALRGEGYEVEEVSNGAQVIERVRAHPADYALVVLDLVMPVMDGREAFERLQRERPQLPVLLCTGYEPAGDPVLGGATTLVKPFTVTDFLERVGKVLQEAGDARGDGDTIPQ